MPPRLIALIASGGLVAVAIVSLFVKVRAAPPAPNAALVDEAAQRHRATATAPSPTNGGEAWRRPSRPAELPPAAAPPDESPAAAMISPEAAATPNLEDDPRLVMSDGKDEANRLYDKMDYEGAMQKALEVLAKEPGDIRMLRVIVSSACQLGDADKAKQYWLELPAHDQNQMEKRCQRFGITFGAAQ